MSDVERYWDAIRKHTGDTRTWHNLHPQEQQMIMQSINLMMMVISNAKTN
jgi:hypothetical protein